MFFRGMSVMGLALGWVKPVFFEAFEHMGDCSFVYRDVWKEWKGMEEYMVERGSGRIYDTLVFVCTSLVHCKHELYGTLSRRTSI